MHSERNGGNKAAALTTRTQPGFSNLKAESRRAQVVEESPETSSEELNESSFEDDVSVELSDGEDSFVVDGDSEEMFSDDDEHVSSSDDETDQKSRLPVKSARTQQQTVRRMVNK